MRFLFLFFCLTSLGQVVAQTSFCSGDSVVLVLNGYKQGSTLWQQSSDQITWDSAVGKSYNDSLVFTATATLYYRAIVTDGTCDPFYSDTTLVTVRVPTPPLAKAASDVTLYSFTARWDFILDAAGYFLDVATDPGFTSFVSGYQNKRVGNVSTFSVLARCETNYYYRVRDSSCTSISGNSNTITVSIGACPAECTTYKSTCTADTIIDSRDSKNYKTVQIGTQCWMAQNLNVGKMILGIQQQSQYDSLGHNTVEKYCYDDISSNCDIYGGLYLWDEMMAYGSTAMNGKGPQGICPTGWHLPTDNEWTCLEKTLGDSKTAGGKLKDTTNVWFSRSKDASNSSGFSALPSGSRTAPNSFSGFGLNTHFWTATEVDMTYARIRYLDYRYDDLLHPADGYKGLTGSSVRCVKD